MVTKAKLFLRLSDDDTILQQDGIAVYHDKSVSATAATVQVTDASVILVITGGGNAGTDTLTLADAANDTLAELVTVINALAKGWVANLVGQADIDSDLLTRQVATDAYGQSAENILIYENEELIELLITNSLDRVESDANREFISTSYQEIYDSPRDTGELILRQPNVTQVNRIAVSTENSLRAKYNGAASHATIEVSEAVGLAVSARLLHLRSRIGENETLDSFVFSANGLISQLVTGINTASDWTGTTVLEGPSRYLVLKGAQDAKDVEVTLESWENWGGTYEVDYIAGIVEFRASWASDWVWGASGRVLVEYTAGFQNLPADIEQLVLEMVKAAWDLSQKDFSVSEETLGDYAYKLAEGGVSVTRPEWRMTIDRYKRMVA